jgi:hypothetical protein
LKRKSKSRLKMAKTLKAGTILPIRLETIRVVAAFFMTVDPFRLYKIPS